MKKIIFIIFILISSYYISNAQDHININNNDNDIEDALTYYNEGYPVLPYYVKTYEFPAGTKIKKINVDVEVKKIKKNNMAEMSPPIFPIGNETDEKTYKVYPGRWYDYDVGMGIVGKERKVIVTIHLYPIRYIGNKTLYANFNVNIDYELPTHPLFTNDEYDLLIIYPNKYKVRGWERILQKLVEYKEKEGIRTKLVSMDEITIGKDLQERIKYFIKDAIEQYGIKYVLLVGDAELMDVRYVSTPIGDVPCDLYFADIYDENMNFSSWDADNDGIYGEREDKPDLYPDVHIGRLPASNEEELSILVNKSINYTTPPMRAIMVGTELFWETDCREGEYLKEEISKDLNIDVIKLYETNEYEKDDDATSTDIINYINEGALFVNFASHGNPYGMGWKGGSFSIDDINKLNNEYLPIVFAMACSTNAFDGIDCLGEKFLTYPKGAIAYIGSSRVAYVYLGKAIKSSLSGYLDKAFFKSYYDGSRSVGEIFSMAKIDYIEKHMFMNSYDSLTVMEYNLLGDPTINIPPMPLTSKAYVNKNKSNSAIKIWAELSENLTNVTVDLYYRKVGRWGGGSWKYYGSSNTTFEWEFLPEEEGYYEFYTILRKGNYTEKKPDIADAYCIFDFSLPHLHLIKPKRGGIYIFNREIFNINASYAIVIGRIDVEAGGDVVAVEFYVDDVLKYIDKEEPFKWKWKEFTFGKHEIKIVGYDIVGNKGEDKIDVYAFII